jgi:hypothetical protein
MLHRFALSQNFLNPISPMTTISYLLLIRSSVKLSVYKLLGQVMTRLVNAVQAAGATS